MKDHLAHDDIDRLIDAVLADPTRAGEVKARLRRRVHLKGAVAVRPARIESPDPDEYWDNVPV